LAVSAVVVFVVDVVVVVVVVVVVAAAVIDDVDVDVVDGAATVCSDDADMGSVVNGLDLGGLCTPR